MTKKHIELLRLIKDARLTESELEQVKIKHQELINKRTPNKPKTN